MPRALDYLGSHAAGRIRDESRGTKRPTQGQRRDGQRISQDGRRRARPSSVHAQRRLAVQTLRGGRCVKAEDDPPPLEPRLANTDDLVSLCRFLNAAGAKYIVIGGFALIQSGFARATSDIDLLIDTSPENFAKVKAAMLKLPDGAVREVNSQDFDEYLVVRVHFAHCAIGKFQH